MYEDFLKALLFSLKIVIYDLWIVSSKLRFFSEEKYVHYICSQTIKLSKGNNEIQISYFLDLLSLKCHILGHYVGWNVRLLSFVRIMVKLGVSIPWRQAKKLFMRCSMKVLKVKVSEFFIERVLKLKYPIFLLTLLVPRADVIGLLESAVSATGLCYQLSEKCRAF